MKSSKGYDRRAVFAWSLYDFANSSFSTIVVTFIFSVYFTRAVAPDEIIGTALWSRVVTISALLIAVVSPFIGALADRGGYRKHILFILTTIAIVSTAMLYTVMPGQIYKGLILFLIANVCMEIGMVFYNAYLPDIAPQHRIGRISGYGWSFGYVGGLIAMFIALIGFVEADMPWFGFSKESGENIRATNLLVSLWFALFSIPMFIWVKGKVPRLCTERKSLISSTLNQLKETFHEIRQYRQIIRFLVARLFYNDALLTIFSFGGIYASGTFGFSFTEILVFGIVLNIAAGLGAFTTGFIDDRIGGKKTIQISNVAFILATLIAILAPNKLFFWVAGIIIGIFSGTNQAASRSLMGRFVPSDKETEFFGFYAFSGKATAFVGPLVLGILTELFGSQRAGFGIVLLLFIIGGLILQGVDEEEGRRLKL